LWSLFARGGVLLGAPNEGSYSASISSSLIAQRKSRFECDESASYAAPDDATAEILPSI
jgi:hypothetical protein